MRVVDIKNEYRNRRYVLKFTKDGEPDPDNKNVIYVGNLKTDKYDMCTVKRFYVFDNMPIRTVTIYLEQL